jgi:hypothetical protein
MMAYKGLCCNEVWMHKGCACAQNLGLDDGIQGVGVSQGLFLY